MSPEQLSQLKELSDTFSEGNAGHIHIRQLSLLLAEMNMVENHNKVEEKAIVDPISS